jgi:hypothetical protein
MSIVSTALLQNPTPQMLVHIKAGQQRRWAELNVKSSWTPDEFEEALFCHSEYMPQQGEWFYSEKTIQQLAFDARTPDDVAVKLQSVAAQMAQIKSPVDTAHAPLT